MDIERYSDSESHYLAWALDLFRDAFPEKKMGFYSYFPPERYWNVIRGQSRRFDSELAELRYRSLASRVDAVFPSLYTHYQRHLEWEEFARGMVKNSYQFSGLVYGFIWPQYHNQGHKSYRLTYLPPEIWRQQLELLYEIADGVVIWGGWLDRDGERMKWDPFAPWWLETLDFMRDRGLGTPDAPGC